METKCPGVQIGGTTPQCRYLMNLKERGRLPPTASTDCNPCIDNQFCARPQSPVYLKIL